MKKLLFVFNILFVLNSFATDKTISDTLSNKKQLEFEYLFTEGVSQSILGDFKSALSIFNKCLELYPTSAAVKYEIASVLLENKDLDKSLFFIREAIKDNPNNIWYKILLANVFQNKSMIIASCEVYNQLLEDYPFREDYYLIQINLFKSIEEWEKALNILNRFEKVVGFRDFIVYERLGLYNKLNYKSKIDKEINNLIKRNPNNKIYVNLLAENYLSKNDEKSFIKLVNKYPNNEFLIYYLIDFYLSKGNTAKANEYIVETFNNENISVDSKYIYIKTY